MIATGRPASAGRRCWLRWLGATIVAACGVVGGLSQASPSASATSAVSSTTTAKRLHLILAELAQHPWRAGDRQPAAGRAGRKGGEQETGFRQCRWQLGIDSALDRCTMYVAVKDQQSFQFVAFPREGSASVRPAATPPSSWPPQWGSSAGRSLVEPDAADRDFET